MLPLSDFHEFNEVVSIAPLGGLTPLKTSWHKGKEAHNNNNNKQQGDEDDGFPSFFCCIFSRLAPLTHRAQKPSMMMTLGIFVFRLHSPTYTLFIFAG